MTNLLFLCQNPTTIIVEHTKHQFKFYRQVRYVFKLFYKLQFDRKTLKISRVEMRSLVNKTYQATSQFNDKLIIFVLKSNYYHSTTHKTPRVRRFGDESKYYWQSL